MTLVLYEDGFIEPRQLIRDELSGNVDTGSGWLRHIIKRVRFFKV